MNSKQHTKNSEALHRGPCLRGYLISNVGVELFQILTHLLVAEGVELGVDPDETLN